MTTLRFPTREMSMKEMIRRIQDAGIADKTGGDDNPNAEISDGCKITVMIDEIRSYHNAEISDR
jgi:hypothetical protein